MLDQFGFPGYATRFAGIIFDGPSSCGSGSTLAHEGSVTVSSNGNYSGIHFYTDFTLNIGVTMTVPAGSGRLVIIATGTITINGTISAVGGGLGSGGSAVTSGNGNAPTTNGWSAVGGAGGGTAAGGTTGGNGGALVWHGTTIQAGAVGTTGTVNGTNVTGSNHPAIVSPLMDFGGAPGGSGGSDGTTTSGIGGVGGATVVLIAPTIVLASGSTITTAGAAGGAASGGTLGINYRGGGGGGGGGNLLIITRSFTDNGATLTVSGGAGGSIGSYAGSAGGTGASGVKQINIYSDQVVRG